MVTISAKLLSIPSQEGLWSTESNGSKGNLFEQLGQCLIYGRLTFKGVCLCTYHRQLILKYDHRLEHHADG